MTWRETVERVRREVLAACYEDLDSFALRGRVLAALSRAVPADGAFFATADPATLLYTSAVREGMPDGVTPLFLRNEFMQPDVNKFRDLAHAASPVSWLDRATRGDRGASPRYRDVMRPIGLGDELRAALRTGDSCWGFLCLHREDGPSGFSQQEAEVLGGLVAHIGEGLRRAVVAQRARVDLDPDGPGVALLATDGTIVSATAAAHRWLAELAAVDRPRTSGLPIAVRAVMLRAAEIARSTQGEQTVPRVRVQAPSGAWLVLHASHLRPAGADAEAAGGSTSATAGSGGTAISLVIEPATSADLAPLVVSSYGFTPRESAVLRRLLQGRPGKSIARELGISLHTVRDHVKSIFEKAGVGSRGELMAEIFRISSRW